MQYQEIQCQDGDTRLVCQYVYDETIKQSRPCVLIFPAFEGRNVLMTKHAERIVAMGYNALVVDMYGDGMVIDTLDGCMAQVKSLLSDRLMVQRRVNLVLAAAKQQTMVDANKTAAIGFCLGGLCCLDLARSGADINGVISVHGVLAAPEPTDNSNIKAKVLALHGYDDPQIPSEQLQAFQQEMTINKVDWQLLYFGDTKHAFTDPQASQIGGPEMGRVYSPIATRRTWQYAQTFFTELFDD